VHGKRRIVGSTIRPLALIAALPIKIGTH